MTHEPTITICPPAAARKLGESTPGWRHDADRSQIGGVSKADIADRIGAPLVPNSRAKRHHVHLYIVCRFFDKVCHVASVRTEKKAKAIVEGLTRKYCFVGARFSIDTYLYRTWTNEQWPSMRSLMNRELKRTVKKEMENGCG